MGGETRPQRLVVIQHRGSIPAWAGKPARPRRTPSCSTVHPRVGGETMNGRLYRPRFFGPSPRGRGNRGLTFVAHNDSRSIPAWAGKPATQASASCSTRVHPRVGGETTALSVGAGATFGPSPRGRGNRRRGGRCRGASRSIPAWAGKPTTFRSLIPAFRVHPRVGGETVYHRPFKRSGRGPSPRGRGNRAPLHPRRPLSRSIPAWAGKP